MAVTLAQTAAITQNQLVKGVMETFVQESAIFDRIRLAPISGNAYSYNAEEALPGTAFRTVNEAYVESTGVINQQTERLAILGGDADVDRFLQQTSGESLGDLRATQTRMKVKSANSTYSDALFNGDVAVNAKSFDGLRKRLVGAQVLEAGSTLAQDTFLDDLDLLFARVAGGAPDVVYADESQIARLKALGRKVGGAEYINSEITGKREWTWNGVAFVDPGEHWSGRKILAAGDMYAVKFASGIGVDQGVLGITNGGVQAYDLGELQEKPAYRTRIEFYCGLAVQGGKAAARLTGITNA